MTSPPNRTPAVLLAMTLTVAAVTILATAGSLPPVLAAHFDAAGSPTGYSVRGVYLAVMLGVAVGLPLLIVASMHSVRSMPERRLNLPRRDYWLTPAHREEAFAALTRFGCTIGIAVSVFAVGVHLFVLGANLRPDRAVHPLLVAWLIALLAVLALIIGAMLRHFARPQR